MIDNHMSGQHDPVDLLYRLVDSFDKECLQPIHRAVLSFTMSHRFTCCKGHVTDLTGEDESSPVLMAYPARAFSKGADANSSVHLDDAIHGLSKNTYFCKVCGIPYHGNVTPSFCHIGNQLAIHIVWPLLADPKESFAQDSCPQFSSQSFMISRDIDLLPLTDPSIRATSVSAKLTGVLCQVGGYIDSGHYISFVNVDDSWWRIDNEDVLHIYTLNEAFENGHTPILLTYRVVMAKAPMTIKLKLKPETCMERRSSVESQRGESKHLLFAMSESS